MLGIRNFSVTAPRLQELPLRKVCLAAFAIGLLTSLLYAWSAMQGHPWGLTAHSLLYAMGVIPMAVGYVSAMCLWFLLRQVQQPVSGFKVHGSERPQSIINYPFSIFNWLAAPGRMAQSNYISQSLVGVLLFYGIGLGLGCSFGLVYGELTAFAVFVLQIVISKWWLRHFRFGPLEWLWRILTYGRYFSFKVTKEGA